MVIIHPYISIIYLESSPCPQDIPSNIGRPPHTLCPAVFDLLVIITAASLLADSLHTCVSALWVLYEGNSCALPTRPAGAFSSSYCTYYSQAFFTDLPSISLDSKLGRLGSFDTRILLLETWGRAVATDPRRVKLGPRVLSLPTPPPVTKGVLHSELTQKPKKKRSKKKKLQRNPLISPPKSRSQFNLRTRVPGNGPDGGSENG